MIAPTPNYEGFNVTFQTTEDCNLACFVAGTKVLMSDFTYKNIEDILVGDEVLGFNENSYGINKQRKIFPTKVTHTFFRNSKTLDILTTDGNSVTCSPEHPFLTSRGAWRRAEDLNSKRPIMKFHGIREYDEADINSTDYQIGYVISAWLGDGCMFHGFDKKQKEVSNYRFAVKDQEFLDRVEDFLKKLKIGYSKYPFKISEAESKYVQAIYISKKSEQIKLKSIIDNNFNINITYNYMCGFLAGIIDAEGTVECSYIKIFNSDAEIIKQCETILQHLKMDYTFDKDKRPVNKVVRTIRILNKRNTTTVLRLLKIIHNIIDRKTYTYFYNRSMFDKIDIAKIIKSDNVVPVFNLETESATYIANNFLVHNCKYCYEIDKKRKDLSLDQAKKFIHLLLDDTENLLNIKNTEDAWILNQGLILDFIGGDSLMRPKLLDEILTYFQFYATLKNHKWAHRWRASISTNGTLFSPEVKAFMTKWKNNLSVGISIDGCPEIHDKNRVFIDGRPSMPKIREDYDWYYAWSNGNPSTKATLNKESIPYMYDSIKFLHEELNFTQISMNFIFEDMGLEDSDYEEIERQCSLIIPYILEHRKDIYVSMFSKEFGTSNKYHPADDKDSWKKGWCGGGCMPCITPNGKIYPCFRFTKITMDNSQNIPELLLGDLENGFNKPETLELIRSQSREKISPPECFTCDCEKTCAWCIGGVYSTTGKFYRPTTLCKVKKIIAKWSDKYWDEYLKLKNEGK